MGAVQALSIAKTVRVSAAAPPSGSVRGTPSRFGTPTVPETASYHGVGRPIAGAPLRRQLATMNGIPPGDGAGSVSGGLRAPTAASDERVRGAAFRAGECGCHRHDVTTRPRSPGTQRRRRAPAFHRSRRHARHRYERQRLAPPTSTTCHPASSSRGGLERHMLRNGTAVQSATTRNGTYVSPARDDVGTGDAPRAFGAGGGPDQRQARLPVVVTNALQQLRHLCRGAQSPEPNPMTRTARLQQTQASGPGARDMLKQTAVRSACFVPDDPVQQGQSRAGRLLQVRHQFSDADARAAQLLIAVTAPATGDVASAYSTLIRPFRPTTAA